MKTKKSIIQINYFLAGLLFIFADGLFAQATIHLNNPSFEDNPRAGTYKQIINGWQDCGFEMFPGESPPDIHPVPSSAWEVNMRSYDGDTYLGLVVRYNSTYESVSQKLESSLKKDSCYSFSMWLARSEVYESLTRRSMVENFITPAVLRIWGGNEFCDRVALLSISQPVDNSIWKQNDFEFKSPMDFTYITLEAYYSPGKEAYNGHVMVDNLSPIVEVGCR